METKKKIHKHLAVDLPAHVTNEVLKMYFNMGYEVTLKLENGIRVQADTYIKNTNEKENNKS